MASPLSYTKKVIQATIKLASGTFDGKNNVKVLSGLRIAVTIKKGGHPSKNEATAKIYGMLGADMNKLTMLSFKALQVSKNQLQIFAGDTNGTSLAFQGEITEACADYKSAPELMFEIKSMEGFYHGVAPAAPQSSKGGQSVATLMQSLSGQMGCTFENNGVTASVHSPYLQGSAYDQAADLADAADLEFGVDNGVMFIAPRGAARSGDVPVISATTGMKSYPTFDKKGIKVECLYNPSIKLGGLVIVQSSIQAACGKWRVHGLEHELECEKQNGKWETKFSASWIGA
jgi:hypothetical protein